jgi:hypothetical protein
MKMRNYIILTKEDIAVRTAGETAIDALVNYAYFIQLWKISKNLCEKTLKILSIEEAVAFLNAHVVDNADSVKAVYGNYDIVYEEDRR